jgi:hypothetical protein
MGNEPAGQLHRHEQPPFLAACSAAATPPVAFAFPPAPAMTVTAAPLAAVFDEATRPPFEIVVALAEDLVDSTPLDEPAPATTVTAVPFAAADVALDTVPSAFTVVLAEPEPATTVTAAPFTVEVADIPLLFTVVLTFDPLPAAFAVALDAPPPPATTVTGPAFVPDAAAALMELLLPPDPACIVTAAREEPTFEAASEPFVDVELATNSAGAVTADTVLTLAAAEALLRTEVLLAFEVPFPPPVPSALTVITLLIVVTAEARDDRVSAAALASSFDCIPAEIVTAAFVPFALVNGFSIESKETGAASALAPSTADFCKEHQCLRRTYRT